MLLSSLYDLHDLLGSEAVQALVSRWGGLRLYIPSRFRADHPIAECISAERFRLLVQRYGGETITLPRRTRVQTKKAAIIDLLAQSVSQRNIARQLGVSQRYVEKVAAMLRSDSSAA